MLGTTGVEVGRVGSSGTPDVLEGDPPHAARSSAEATGAASHLFTTHSQGPRSLARRPAYLLVDENRPVVGLARRANGLHDGFVGLLLLVPAERVTDLERVDRLERLLLAAEVHVPSHR